MLRQQLFIGAALLTGVAVGYFAGGHGSAVPEATEVSDSVPVVRGKVADVGESASLNALRARIRELEQQLTAASARSVAPVAETSGVRAATAPEPPRWGNPRAHLEELKKSNPERYAQITNNIAQFRRNRQRRQESQMAFLSSIDTSQMSAAAKKTHEDLQNLIVQRAELEEQLYQEDLPNEKRHELMQELRRTGGALYRLNQAERSNLLEETARNLGFSGEDVKEISQTIGEVIEATDSGFGFGMRPRHGPPQGGRR